MRFAYANAGFFELTPLPGCSQAVVSHDMFLRPEYRGQGLAYPFADDRIEVAKDLGYDIMICTVDKANIAQIKTLENKAWVFANEFVSSKTGHTVVVYTKVIV